MPADDLIERLERGAERGLYRGEAVQLTARDCRRLVGHIARLNRETTLVLCDGRGRGVPSRDLAGGRCAGCLLAERDGAREEATKAKREMEILLWNNWLHTPGGKGYEAGWGDDASREHAARGRAWVAARMAEKGLAPAAPAGGGGEGASHE